MTTIRKSIEFDYGHRIADHESQCRNVHGHRGKLEVELSGELSREGAARGMVIDFGLVKKALVEITNHMDHAFVVSVDDPILELISRSGEPTTKKASRFGSESVVSNFGRIVAIPYPPTAENLAFICYTLLRSDLGPQVKRVTFWETPTSCAIYPGISA